MSIDTTAKPDWWVYSTATEDHVLLVKDRKSTARGYVENPTPDEWSKAFHAPSNPYPWTDPSRIIVDRGTAPEFDQETKAAALAIAGKQCEGSVAPAS
jgi:hypothetical protein